MEKKTDKQELPVVSGPRVGRGVSLAPLVILLILVCTVAISVITYFSLQALDELSSRALKDRIGAALTVELQRLEDLNREYSYWDIAYEKLVRDGASDGEWGKTNTGRYLTDNYGIDLVLAQVDGGQPTAAYIDGESVPAETLRHVAEVLQPLSEKLAGTALGSAISTGYMRIDGSPYQVAFGRFVDETSQVARDDGSGLLLAREIDDGYIDGIVSIYMLPALGTSAQPNGTSLSWMPLLDFAGIPIVYLNWQAETPGDAFLAKLLPPGIATLALLLVITWVIVHLDARLRRRHLESLESVASRDFLTGVSNRREFFYLAAREMNRARRESQPLCLMLMDIDHFKRINDLHGHETGDRVLVDLATRVYEHLREFDVFARWGGEEFIVMLPNADMHTGLETAERLRHMIETAGDTNSAIRYTVSIGVAIWDGGEGIDELIRRADRALYRAKAVGRNRTQLAIETVAGSQ